MEVIETIVIQNAEVEGKETVVSTVVDTDKSKAGKYPLKVSPPLSSSHRMKRGVPGECAVPAFCRACCNKQNLRSASNVSIAFRISGVYKCSVIKLVISWLFFFFFFLIKVFCL